jgi:hypothetical protein
MSLISASTPLLADVRQLIDSARQRVASTVNAELTQLYWQIGSRVSAELLKGQRAEYGKQVVAELAQQLTTEFGKGWSERQLRYCLSIAEVFPDAHILHTLCSQLSWSHLRLIIQIDEPLKRDFYIEICRVERWSVRQLQERINSLLFERTAISKKPEETIRQDLTQLRTQGQQGEATPIGLILCTGKSQELVELLQVQQSNIRVADYLTLLPSREVLQTKLHQSIELARAKLNLNLSTAK